MDLRDGGLCGMEENKKSGGGDVRAEVLASLAARRKSRFAEKKSASPKKNCACGGWRGCEH